jgi:diguanylate cyclase (GGDEF)-like protein
MRRTWASVLRYNAIMTSEPVSILLLTDDADRQSRWAEMLSSAEVCLWKGVAQLPADAKLDVIVADRAVVGDTLATHNKHLARGEIGVVSIGTSAVADVSLPSDFTRRELKLTCLLLAAIVRLRREQRHDKRARKVLSQLALSDPLTGLPNRRAWEAELRQRGQDAASAGRALCVALLDLDHLKQVNANFGHLAGDQMLRDAGRALVESARREDFVARLGGDEFALLIGNLKPGTAAGMVEHIRQTIGQRLQASNGHPMTASAGLAESSNTSEAEITRLLAAADEALRQAKAAGRARTVVLGGETSLPS